MSLDAHKRALGKCTYCPKLCRFCCPTAEAECRETVTPWAKMSLAEMGRLNRLAFTAEVAEIFYHCLACLHCRTHCEHDNDVPAALIEARQRARRDGGEPAIVKGIVSVFRGSGNAWGENLQALLRKRLDERYFVPEAQAVVFAGCEAIRQDGRVAALFELFDLLRVDYVAAWAGEAICCGVPLWQAGDLEGFREHAAGLARELSRLKTVVCPCPTCVHVLKGLYAESGVEVRAEVLHVTEFLEPLIAAQPPRREVADPCVFHDPCYLSRYLERSELPRKLLDGVLEHPLRDLVWSGPDSFCCGGGGLVPRTLPEVASATAGLRMKQLRATGAERVITACPGCIRQLGGVPDGLPVSDLVDVLLEGYRS